VQKEKQVLSVKRVYRALKDIQGLLVSKDQLAKQGLLERLEFRGFKAILDLWVLQDLSVLKGRLASV
jgi:hypothetical protein